MQTQSKISTADSQLILPLLREHKLRADPYEIMPEHSEMYMRWFFDNIWVFPLIGEKIQAFLSTIPQYPFQEGLQLDLTTTR